MSESQEKEKSELLKDDMQPEMQFEEAMDKLEQIVEQLERGEVPLEKAIELFQEGMKLSGICSRKLEQVEKKIEMLVEEDGQWVKKSFKPPEEEQGDLF